MQRVPTAQAALLRIEVGSSAPVEAVRDLMRMEAVDSNAPRETHWRFFEFHGRP